MHKTGKGSHSQVGSALILVPAFLVILVMAAGFTVLPQMSMVTEISG